MRILIIAIAALLGLGYGGAKFYLYYKTSQSMQAAVQMLAPIMEVKYGGISSSFSGKLTIDDLQITINEFEDPITIGSLGIVTPSIFTLLELGQVATGESQAPGKMPEYFGIFAEDLRLVSDSDYYKAFYRESMKTVRASDRNDPGPICVGKYGMFSPRALKAMNYDAQVVSLAMTLRQGETDFTIDLDTSVDDMFDNKLILTLGGNMMVELSRGSAYRPKLRNLRMAHTDRSLTSRIAKYCAELGLSPQQTLASHMDALRYFGEQSGIVFDEYVIEPYQEFLTGKAQFIVTAKPRRLIDFAEISFYNPKDVPALLNLEAVAQ